jgi:hypothetical protein
VTTNSENDRLPKYAWWALGLTAVLLLALTVGAIGFISAGFFDPKPIGGLTAELSLEPVSLAAQTQSIEWLDPNLITADSFTLRLSAANQSGDLDSGYGLALGSDDSVLIAAVSPLGYVLISQLEAELDTDTLDNMIANGPTADGNGRGVGWPLLETPESENALLPWQPWPHVKRGLETNEIWLDKRGETVTIYVNRELLWSGPISPLALRPQIGLYAAAFNRPATINFNRLEIFSEIAITPQIR